MKVKGKQQIRIARREDVVRAQFYDVRHHCDNKVHSGPPWRLQSDIEGRKTVKMGRQVAEIFWEDDVLWLSIIHGPGAGSTIAHRFATIGMDTEVVATFSVPLPGPLMPLAPLVRWLVARKLRNGLLEDSIDLQTYQPG